MFEAIANFINTLISALKGLAKIGNIASNPVGAIFGTENAEPTVQQSEEREKSLPTQTEKQTFSQKRARVTLPLETISARFNDTGSPAWKNQPGGKHLGTDFSSPNGSAVYAPYAMHVIKIGHYDDDGRRGDYVIGTLLDGTEYYSGHLSNVKVSVGDYINAGQQIAQIGFYNHTHIQLRVSGALYDFEQYEKTH